MQFVIIYAVEIICHIPNMCYDFKYMIASSLAFQIPIDLIFPTHCKDFPKGCIKHFSSINSTANQRQISIKNIY